MKTKKMYGFVVDDSGFIDLGSLSIKFEIVEMSKDEIFNYILGRLLVSIGEGRFRQALYECLHNFYTPWYIYQEAKRKAEKK